ncbi:MAG: Ycf66 family protein [Cyanobacteria bacterium J06635_11]
MLVNTLLADTLAVLLGLGSVTFYVAAFLYPEVHRRSDFVWSGLGVLYALILWFGAAQITGIVLVGQISAVALLLGLGWQTLSVRRQKTPVAQQTPIVITPEVVSRWTQNKVNQLRIVPTDTVPVRLEKRASGSGRLDPRRRPAYDYEFVEDGIAKDEAIASEDVDAAADLAADLEGAVETTVPATAEPAPYPIPPSVEAKIISVEEPAAIADEPTIPEIIPEATANEATLTALAPSEPEAMGTETSEQDTSEQDTSEQSTPEQDTSEALDSSLDESDDWDDDFFEDDEGASEGASEGEKTSVSSAKPTAVPAQLVPEQGASPSSAVASQSAEPAEVEERAVVSSPQQPGQASAQPVQRSAQLPTEKPSLMAMPLILAGWVKDLVVSMTKPKPPKPVIDIPRRDASPAPSVSSAPSPTVRQPLHRELSVEDREEAVVRPTTVPVASSQPAYPPMSTAELEMSSDSGPDSNEDSWEESNWDD